MECVDTGATEGMMIVAVAGTELQTLEDRLARGADLLFDMEQRGDTGLDYARWLEHYEALLAQYEALAADRELVAA
jgi:hypothetical protein